MRINFYCLQICSCGLLGVPLTSVVWSVLGCSFSLVFYPLVQHVVVELEIPVLEPFFSWKLLMLQLSNDQLATHVSAILRAYERAMNRWTRITDSLTDLSIH